MALRRLIYALVSVVVWTLAAPFASAQGNPDSIISGEMKGGFRVACCSVTQSEAVVPVTIGGRKALQLSLEYAWKGGALDWARLGTPGYAQRMSFDEKPGKEMMPERDYWYTASFLFPSSNPPIYRLDLMDFKHFIADGNVPSIAFTLQPEGLMLIENLDSPWTCGNYRNVEGNRTAACNRVDTNGVVASRKAISNRWVQMVAHVRWSNADGIVQLWLDGRPIMSVTGDTLHGSEKVKFKFGPYRHHMNGDPGKVIVYYSEVARAGACEDLALVDCDFLMEHAPKRGLQNISNVHHDRFDELDEMRKLGR